MTRGPAPWLRALTLAGLALATLAAFAGAWRNGWVYFDDPTYVFANPHVASGWSAANAAWFLTHAHSSNWHPLTSWSHLADVQLFGLAPGPQHAVNVVLHVLDVVLLVLVFCRMTGDWWRALVAGALFGLHPLRVESVAWISERKDVLSMAFFLLTLLAYERWTRRPGAWRAAAVAAAFALGLLAKPMLVTAPLVLVLLDVWPLGRWTGTARAGDVEPRGAPVRTLQRLVLEKWPLLLLSAASAVVTFLVQRASGAVAGAGAVPIAHRAANAVVTLWRYLGMTLWPVRLAPFYPDAHVRVATGALAAAGAIAVTVLVLRRARTQPRLAVGWGWYVITLLPVIGLVQVGAQGYADRYTYLPMIGPLLALVWTEVPRRAARAFAAAAFAASALLFVLTQRQVARWHDTLTLFSAAIRDGHDSAAARNAIGTALLLDHRADEAIADFKGAIILDPGLDEPYLNLADAYNVKGDPAASIPIARAAERAMPGDPRPFEVLALAESYLGRLDDAARDDQRALALGPDDVRAMRQLGLVRAIEGRTGESLRLLRAAVAIAPRDHDAQYVLGKVLAAGDATEREALAHLREAVRLEPGWAPPLGVIAAVLVTAHDPALRDPAQAVRLATRAVELSGGTDAGMLATQSDALAAVGRTRESGVAAHRALHVGARALGDSLRGVLRARAAAAGFAVAPN